MLTDDEIRKAAESAAEQMWPESGYVGWTDEDAEFHRLFLEACIAKLTAGVELPEAMGYLCDWGNDSYGLTHQTVYYGEPGSAIEDDWNKHPTVHENTQIFTRDQLLAYGAAQRLAGREQDKADAERYRWLTAQPNGGFFHPAFAASSLVRWKNKAEFDPAIDAAMKRGEA